MPKSQRPTVTPLSKESLHESIVNHPSFAVVRVLGTHGRNVTLFGSDSVHNDYVTIEVAPADLKRSINNDWIHGDSTPIIQFNMSHAQFVSMIQNKGNGAGTPVTLTIAPKSMNTDLMSVPLIEPLQSNVELIKDEINEQVQKRVEKALALITELESAVEDKKGIKIIRELMKDTKNAIGGLPNSLSYSVGQAHEEINKSVQEATVNVEAMIQTKLKNIGVHAIQNGHYNLLDNIDDSEPLAETNDNTK